VDNEGWIGLNNVEEWIRMDWAFAGKSVTFEAPKRYNNTQEYNRCK